MATEEERRQAAIERLKGKRAFQQNVLSYVAINVFLIIVWAASGGGYFWPIWVMGGWGVGLVLHAWETYARPGITEDAVRREMERGGGDTLD